MKMKLMSIVVLVLVGLSGCKTPATVAGSSGTTGSTTPASTGTNSGTESLVDVAPDVAVEGTTLPFDNRLQNIEVTSTDTKKLVGSFGFVGHVKAGVLNQRLYITQTLEPLMFRAGTKILSSKSSEELSEGNWSEIQSEIFREIQGMINPQEVKLKELKQIQITLL
jgi:hypothetical protein